VFTDDCYINVFFLTDILFFKVQLNESSKIVLVIARPLHKDEALSEISDRQVSS